MYKCAPDIVLGVAPSTLHLLSIPRIFKDWTDLKCLFCDPVKLNGNNGAKYIALAALYISVI